MTKIQSRIAAFVVAMAIGGISAIAGVAVTEDVKIPDTPAGTTLAAFLDAFNSGDINKMKAFHREKGGSEENADKDMGFYEQSGGLKVLSVSSSEDFEITVIAETRKDGTKVRFNMTVDSQAPHGIQGIRVQPEE
ncbi:MAG: hypothetical protein IPM66_04075 [Acidobacteriota bacterium]|nr:MAG: hypothetical protein IPM66_04075 [Acidobacteriota bacterium]